MQATRVNHWSCNALRRTAGPILRGSIRRDGIGKGDVPAGKTVPTIRAGETGGGDQVPGKALPPR